MKKSRHAGREPNTGILLNITFLVHAVIRKMFEDGLLSLLCLRDIFVEKQVEVQGLTQENRGTGS